MAQCRKQKKGARCTLKPDHFGPWHVDERTNTGWFDENLKQVKPKPKLNPPTNPDDGSM